MSSRALRKLQNDTELLKALVGSSSVEASESENNKPYVQKTNIFALMNDGDDTEEDYEASGSENESVKSGEERESNSERITLATKSKKKSKQRKNKKKNKQKKNNTIEDEDDQNEEEEELERMIQQFRKKDVQKYGLKKIKATDDDTSDDEFQTASEPEDDDFPKAPKNDIMHNLQIDSGFSWFSANYLKSCSKFFNSDFKKLDPHFEFKMLFDDLTSESLDDIDSMTSTHISPQQLKQIQRMKRLLKNWGGKDHRSVPNGPGSNARRLQFTKVREDWLPTPRGELSMRSLSADEILDWQLWQRPCDWKEVIQEDIQGWKRLVSFYKFEPLNPDLNRKGMTDFYMSVVLHPDHEALIHLISSKFPYHVAGLLQVALIMVRQGDRSNTNGLIQRALFVFDRALKSNVKFDSLSCQLPYIYFFNRQFYLAIFRYVLSLAQRGAVGTAGEWCKVLWSLSPLEDPLGCRYFIDHYLLLNNEFQYLIELSSSPLANSYRQWYTLGISLGTVLSYLHIGDTTAAKKELTKAFKYHSTSLAKLYSESLGGKEELVFRFSDQIKEPIMLELKSYMARFPLLWKKPEHLSFLRSELASILQDFEKGIFTVEKDAEIKPEENSNPFFIKNIPINLLRFAVLSEESSVMASIPKEIWSDYQVYEFDVLPPVSVDRESIDTIESIKNFISDHDLSASQVNAMQDEDLLNQIRQMSLEEYLGNANES